MSSPETTPGANSQIEIDTFGDLIEDGWTVRMREEDTGPQTLLVPPGFIKGIEGTLTAERLARIPSVNISTFSEDDGLTRIAKGGVQSRNQYDRQRHPAFEPKDRRANILCQRAFKSVNADKFQFNWVSNGGGLNGSSNYEAYKAEEERLTEQLKRDTKAGEIKWLSDEWHRIYAQIGSEAVRATWIYQKVAEPLGLTEISGVSTSLPVGSEGSFAHVKGYLKSPEKE